MSSIFVISKFKCAHLKFTAYGFKKSSKQASTHMHVRNVVTLVWGSLRLTPITVSTVTYTTLPHLSQSQDAVSLKELQISVIHSHVRN